MKIAVVGCRRFQNFTFISDELDKLDPPPTMIISGGADGVDSIAYHYARKKGITFVCHPPLEDEKEKMGFSRSAKRRNLRIAEHCEHLVAFPSGQSKGTWHTVSLAKKLGKPVTVIKI